MKGGTDQSKGEGGHHITNGSMRERKKRRTSGSEGLKNARERRKIRGEAGGVAE